MTPKILRGGRVKNTPPKKPASASNKELTFCTTHWLYLNINAMLEFALKVVKPPENFKIQIFPIFCPFFQIIFYALNYD